MGKSSDHKNYAGPVADGAAAVSRFLMRSSRKAFLNTLSQGEVDGLDGWPSASLVTVATHWDAGPILMLSDIAQHAKNIQADNRIALLFDGTTGFANPQEGPRVSVVGRLVKTADERLHRRFIAGHPRAALYAGFADFNFYVLKVEKIHFVGGFARAVWLSKRKALLAKAQWSQLADREQAILDHMNNDHSDALRHYGTNLLGKKGKYWSMTGIDPEGCDLKCGESYHRLNFKQLATDAKSSRKILADLAS